MSAITIALRMALGLLMVDAAIEMAFISSMVYWLHYRAGKAFEVNYNGGTFSLHGKPVGLLANQGHTSNGAAGTAFVLIGLGGILALWLRSRAARNPGSGLGKFGKFWCHFWLVMTVPSVLLALAAVIYTFILTVSHSGQTINLALASGLHNEPYPNYVAYPLELWTPENWFTAVLELPLAKKSEVSDIQLHLAVMKGWRWNLIPLLVFGLAVCVLAFADAAGRRKEAKNSRVLEEYGMDGKRTSA